jgi:hypothetical protein
MAHFFFFFFLAVVSYSSGLVFFPSVIDTRYGQGLALKELQVGTWGAVHFPGGFRLVHSPFLFAHCSCSLAVLVHSLFLFARCSCASQVSPWRVFPPPPPLPASPPRPRWSNILTA